MCHVTRYCNVIGLAQYSAAGHGLYQYMPLPFFAVVGLGCETAPPHT